GEAVARAVRERQPRMVVLVARGTSDHAAIYGRYLIEAQLGLVSALAAPSILTVYERRPQWRDALVVAVSQSGQSDDVAAVITAARESGALTVTVTNDPSSPLAGASEYVMGCRAGEERAVAATKTYVAELAVIAALVALLADDAALRDALKRLPAALADSLALSTAWLERSDTLVTSLAVAERALVFARGYNFPTALEVALKLKETSRLFAEGYSAADLLHGPVALAGPPVPTLVFRPHGPMGRALDEAIARVAASGAPNWIIGAPDERRGRDAPPAGPHLVLPDDLPEPLTPLTYVLPGFLLAEVVSRRRGLDPDTPAGLSKVTRTR
ncbi:MAG: SIS domain-containing protein, partial [Chloroflexota bacterium]|nr:SIS domain-containing protein [Chloroflexota bacterium]